MAAAARVTRGFPRIGFPLTTSRQPISLHLALGSREKREKERERNENCRISHSFYVGGIHVEVLSEGTSARMSRIKRKERDRGNRELQVASGGLKENSPTVHPATTRFSYITSQVQYSCARLFKAGLSRLADKR